MVRSTPLLSATQAVMLLMLLICLLDLLVLPPRAQGVSAVGSIR